VKNSVLSKHLAKSGGWSTGRKIDADYLSTDAASSLLSEDL